MGHCDSSKGQRGGREICDVGGGFSAVDEKCVNAVMKTRGLRTDQKRDRRKSVPPSALTNTQDQEGRALRVTSRPASPAPTPEVIKPRADEQSVTVKAALVALRIYKVYLSILFAGSCRFEPTCSTYMYEAVERFGVMRGSWMGLQRLLRCQPLSRKFGYDPVPEKTKAAETGESKHQAGRGGVAGREAHS
jgi:putative membrane protein insertion efficiency factor